MATLEMGPKNGRVDTWRFYRVSTDGNGALFIFWRDGPCEELHSKGYEDPWVLGEGMLSINVFWVFRWKQIG